MPRLLSVLLFALAAFAADPPESPLAVHALAVYESDGKVWRVNVSLGNRGMAALSRLKVSISPSGKTVWEIPSLAPGEWKNDTISLGTGNARSLMAVIEYNADKRVDSLAEPVVLQEAEKPWWIAVTSAAVPVALGALISFLGMKITSSYSEHKERLTAMLQWKRFLVEKYDQPYRAFLAACGGVLDAPSMRVHFTTLDTTALVPDRLRGLINAGIDHVEKATDAPGRRAARDAFLSQLRSELLEPFKGT